MLAQSVALGNAQHTLAIYNCHCLHQPHLQAGPIPELPLWSSLPQTVTSCIHQYSQRSFLQAGPCQEDLGTFIEGLGDGDLSRVLDMSTGRHRVLREVCSLVSPHRPANIAAEHFETLL